jgi:hypothetical protein
MRAKHGPTPHHPLPVRPDAGGRPRPPADHGARRPAALNRGRPATPSCCAGPNPAAGDGWGPGYPAHTPPPWSWARPGRRCARPSPATASHAGPHPLGGPPARHRRRQPAGRPADRDAQLPDRDRAERRAPTRSPAAGRHHRPTGARSRHGGTARPDRRSPPGTAAARAVERLPAARSSVRKLCKLPGRQASDRGRMWLATPCRRRLGMREWDLTGSPTRCSGRGRPIWC